MDKKILFLWMCILTILAGMINAIAIFGYDGWTVSHVTGLVSKVAIGISTGDLKSLWEALSIMLCFLLGAIISGIVSGQRTFYLRKGYGFVIMAIGFLILIPIFIKIQHSLYLFAFIMGLQNGMVVSYKGVVVRMTHMSGNLTDLGVYIGYKIRRNKNEKLITGLVPFAALLHFTCGGVIGVLLYQLMNKYVFILLSFIYILLSIFYLIFQHRCNDKNLNGIPDDLEYSSILEE